MNVLLGFLPFLIGGLAGGFLWARGTDRLPLPEWLLMLTSPIGAAVVLTPLVGAFLCWQVMRDAAQSSTALGLHSIVQILVLSLKYGGLGGILAGGLPAILGWVAGHRRPGR